MEIRNLADRRDLRAAMDVRDRAWRVGYRAFVDEALIDTAVADPDEEQLQALEQELDNEAGNFLVAEASTSSADEEATDEASGDSEETTQAEHTGTDGEPETSSGPLPDVVGFVRIRWGSTSPHVGALEAEIVDLYVDPARWREGVGTALLDAVSAWVPGIVEGVAVTVLEANDRGGAFLDASGFERDGTVRDSVGGQELEHAIYRQEIDRS